MLSGGEHGTTFRHYIKKIRTITMLQETHAHTLLYISAQCTARLSLTDFALKDKPIMGFTIVWAGNLKVRCTQQFRHYI